jgi:hypothetical protein
MRPQHRKRWDALLERQMAPGHDEREEKRKLVCFTLFFLFYPIRSFYFGHLHQSPKRNTSFWIFGNPTFRFSFILILLLLLLTSSFFFLPVLTDTFLLFS